MIRRSLEVLRFGFDFLVLRAKKPFAVGLVTNDTCNLRCRHCRVANTFGYRMSYDEVRGHLERFHRLGARVVYFEGGEPYLWKDGSRRLGDLVELAREIGYLRVHVYTNGTRPLDAHPDFTWVSIDGLGETLRTLRGIEIETVLDNVRALKGRYAVVFVVNTVNLREIRGFLEFVRAELPPALVMFFFHTPYYGADELLLSPEQKGEAIDAILRCKREGLPVMNSRAGLDAIRTGRYRHPGDLSYVVDQTGDYRCCRAIGHPEVCESCGYASGAELALAQSLRPGPFLAMLGSF
jgi:MoaA/NifB/PqqE/SkfB family radical SAM enzyme